MFPTVKSRRGRRKKDVDWNVVVPARRTLTGKRITKQDIRRVTRKRKRKGTGTCKSASADNNTGKNAGKNATEKEQLTTSSSTDASHRLKPGRRRAKAKRRPPSVPRAKNEMGGLKQVAQGLCRPRTKKHDKNKKKTVKGKWRVKALRPRSKNKSDISQAMTGKKVRKQRRGNEQTSVGSKTATNDCKVKELSMPPQGPHEHTRAELESFTKQRLKKLRQEQVEVGALHCRIAELEAEAESMTARHLIHTRRELQKQIEEMRDKAQKIESGDEINNFCQEVARFFYTFDRLQQEEAEIRNKEEETALSTSSAAENEPLEDDNMPHLSLHEDGLVQNNTIDFDSDKKGDQKKSHKVEGEGEVEIEIENVDIFRPEGTVITEEEQITREQVPALVMPDHIQDMIRERQRQVTKPDLRVMTRGRGSSSVCADSFLERFGSVSKPLCTLSDEKCSMCGTGRLVLDVVADVLVCEHCRHEQTSSQSSDRNVGYNNAKSMHYSACRYKRITHFVAHLDRFCGCVGSSKLTPKLLSKVMQWLKTHNVKRVKISNVEEALKDMGHNKLTNHKVVITACITGIKPPRFTPDERNQMIEMFLASEHAFAYLRRTGQLEGRLNYLNYTYTMYKFVEIMKWGNRFLKYFRLLRGKENLAKQDRYWRKVCKIVGLPFIRSV